MAEYRLTPAAEDDMEGIWRYSAKEWSAQKANDYTDLLTSAFSDLAARPTKARPCDEIRKGYCRFNVASHTVYLTVEPYGVAIVRILHQSMDAQRHL